jgi:hypothetical protein
LILDLIPIVLSTWKYRAIGQHKWIKLLNSLACQIATFLNLACQIATFLNLATCYLWLAGAMRCCMLGLLSGCTFSCPPNITRAPAPGVRLTIHDKITSHISINFIMKLGIRMHAIGFAIS